MLYCTTIRKRSVIGTVTVLVVVYFVLVPHGLSSQQEIRDITKAMKVARQEMGLLKQLASVAGGEVTKLTQELKTAVHEIHLRAARAPERERDLGARENDNTVKADRGEAPGPGQPQHNFLEERFSEVYFKNLWGNSESRSGDGSSLKAASRDIEYLYGLVTKLHPGKKQITLIDFPCGDMNWMPTLVDKFERSGIAVNYHGYDIVPQLIERNIKKFQKRSQYTFTHIDGTKRDAELARGDVLLSRDVVNHLHIRENLNLLRNFVRSGTPTLIISSNRVGLDAQRKVDHQELRDNGGGGSRPLDLEEDPFRFPKTSTHNEHLSVWTNEEVTEALRKVSWPGWRYLLRRLLWVCGNE
jgi:hypothetical protein